MKISVFIVVGLLILPRLSNANDVASESEHNCNFDGCRVKCANEKGNWRTVGTAKNIKITIFNSGATRMVLNKGLDGFQTLVMGGSGYICSIENQKD